ncbi:MAG: ParB N-terminal domain-containing protein [Clostridia bacterium]|nr:ParB N-terminal domain-containing protein [Clostridia bacterium]
MVPERTERMLQIIRVNTSDIGIGVWSIAPEDSLALLMASIARHGLLQPVVLRPTGYGGRYMLVCGGRRLEACRRLGMKQIDAVLVEADAHEAIAISMEAHHTARSVHFLEEAEAIRGHGGMRLSRCSALSDAFFARRLRLLDMGQRVCGAVRRAGMGMGQAEPLLMISGEARRLEAAMLIAQRELTPWQARRLICGGRRSRRLHITGADGKTALAAAKEALYSICAELTEAGCDAAVGIHAEADEMTVRMTVRTKAAAQPVQPQEQGRKRRRRIEMDKQDECRRDTDE